MYCYQRPRIPRDCSSGTDRREVRRWGKALLFHLRWDQNGPRGRPIRFGEAVMLSGLKPEMIETVLQYDAHTGRLHTWTESGIAYLRARQSRRATDRSEPQSAETVHDSDPCAVCKEDLTSLDVTMLLCKHKFCARCAWRSGRQCPLCRRDRPPGMFQETRNVPMDFTSEGFDSSYVESSSDDEEFSQRRLVHLFNRPSQMLQIECGYCYTSWRGWNCAHCGRTH